MKARALKVARIGNSRGIRLPADLLERYHIGDSVIIEERSDGILIQPQRTRESKLSFVETADAMALAAEDWSEWDAVLVDGLTALPWDDKRARAVAEPPAAYAAPGRRKGKARRS